MATVPIEPVAWIDEHGAILCLETSPIKSLIDALPQAPVGRRILALFTSESLAQARAEGKAEGMRDGNEAGLRKAAGIVRSKRGPGALVGDDVTKFVDGIEAAILAALPSPPADGETKPPMDSEALFDWLQEHYKSVGVTPALREMYRQYQEATGGQAMSTDLVAENIDLFSKVFRLEAELSSERARVESLQSDVERLTQRDEIAKAGFLAAEARADAACELLAAERRRVEELEAALVRIALKDRHGRIVKPMVNGGFRGVGGMIATAALVGKNGSFVGDAEIAEQYPEIAAALAVKQEG